MEDDEGTQEVTHGSEKELETTEDEGVDFRSELLELTNIVEPGDQQVHSQVR